MTRVQMWGGFESTFLPRHDRDSFETTGHDRRWRADLAALSSAGVRELRYPVRWHRIEPEPGRYDWDETDRVFAGLQEAGLAPVVDLVHHTSHPTWLDEGFADVRFGPAYVRFAEAVARRYPWLPAYTLFNEPFATLFLAGHEGFWPPYRQGLPGLVTLLRNVLPAVTEAARCWREVLPSARHVWVDTCEHHAGTPGAPAEFADVANDRRFVALDLVIGHDLDPDRRPFLRSLVEAGGEPLLELDPLTVDVLGLDYYPHSEWYFDADGGRAPSPYPVGFAAVAEQYARRYPLSLALTETNIRGLPSDRVTWLRYMLEQYELAQSRGVPLEGFCWFPSVDSADWDSLLTRPAGRLDPVGVWSIESDGSRRSTSMTRAWTAAAAGAPAATLPAYRLQSPAAERLAGYLPQLAHWPWQDPSPEDLVPPVQVPPAAMPRLAALPVSRSLASQEPAVSRAVPMSRVSGPADLVVLSHLRWPWVWQRPQHLVSRLAADRARTGGVTWFVEEPVRTATAHPRLRVEQLDGVRRVWLEIPGGDADWPADRVDFLDFGALGTEDYVPLLRRLLDGRAVDRDVWLYTPMALSIAEAVEPRLLVYDVMDDLASFAGAPPALVAQQQAAIDRPDLVFTGGRSLHRGVLARRASEHTHLFPSGVESRHYAAARGLRRPYDRPVAGYVGVIDERLDLDLLGELAAALADWELRMVGPVTKIDPGRLPQAPNLHYPGIQPYDRLPEVMAGFDVALMPFALNEATRAISPTKTLEYLAAGLPVVSTRVPDVVADFGEVVHFADTGEQFAEACREVVRHSTDARDEKVAPIRLRHEWDSIAGAMAALIQARVDEAGVGSPADEEATA
ncbi:MAG: glycosyltransferase, partial [Actinomycetota bacterium]|nr:glycosyltransferase [Actinomycetota bacterium]